MPLLALGSHIFEVAPLNFQSIERATQVKWPAIPRFGNRPGRQFTGYGDDPMTISGKLYPEELGGRDEFEAIRATQRAAQPVMLIGWAAATGTKARIFGQVVILDVFDRQSSFNRAGQSRRLEFDIEVAPYPSDGKPIGLF